MSKFTSGVIRKSNIRRNIMRTVRVVAAVIKSTKENGESIIFAKRIWRV